jgi:hypothetical protein|tara:strand:+ start:159 stop:683 length:525 start_codon:yes stop_codon:yes gene_type:complete
METKMKNISVDIGYKLGGVLALSTILAYAIDFKLFLNPMFGVGFFIIIVAAGIYSTIQSRKINNGASFKQAFTSYFIAIAVGYLLGNLTTILVFVIVDPDAAKVLDEEMLIMTKEMLEGFGMSSDLIALSMDEASKKSNFSLSTIAMQYVGNLIFFSLIGLVTSLILKRDKTEA